MLDSSLNSAGIDPKETRGHHRSLSSREIHYEMHGHQTPYPQFELETARSLKRRASRLPSSPSSRSASTASGSVSLPSFPVSIRNPSATVLQLPCHRQHRKSRCGRYNSSNEFSMSCARAWRQINQRESFQPPNSAQSRPCTTLCLKCLSFNGANQCASSLSSSTQLYCHP